MQAVVHEIGLQLNIILLCRFNKAPFASPTPFSPFTSGFKFDSPTTPLMFKQALQEAEKHRKVSTARQQLAFSDKTTDAEEPQQVLA